MKEFPEIETCVSRTGRAEIATDPMGVEVSDTYLILKPKVSWRFETTEALIRAIDQTLRESVPVRSSAILSPLCCASRS